MFRSYLLTLYRSLTKHQLFSALNIFGLAVGMAVFLVLSIAVRFEFSYDRWIPDSERTFRVNGIMVIPGRPTETIALVAGPVLPNLQAEFGGQIEAGVRLLGTNMAVRRGNLSDYEKVVFADNSFFDVFDLPLAAGAQKAALADTSSLVVSQAMARKYFGQANPMGQRITLNTDGTLRDYRIAAVLKDLPENTHLKIDFLALLSEQVLPGSAEYLDVWNATNYATYVRLPSPKDAETLQAAMPAFMDRRADSDVADWMKLELEPLKDLHFAADQMGAMKPGVDRSFVTMLQIVGVLTLLLAVINYVNLSTARSVLRAREVALRKVFGATRNALVAQFLIEALLVSFVAGLIALALVELSLPFVNTALGSTLALDYLGVDGVLPIFVAIVGVVGLAAGFYPALVISRFEPAGVLAASRAPGGGRAAALLRETLVVAQFTVSIALLIGTGVVFAQADFVRRADLGFHREKLLLVKEVGSPDIAGRTGAVMDAFRRVPGVVAVTISGRWPGMGGLGRSTSFTRAGLVGEPPSLGFEDVGDTYFETYGVPLAAGRKFNAANRMDDLATLNGGSREEISPELQQNGVNVIINEAAARALGWRNPRDAVGKAMRQPEGTVAFNIIGVAKDVRFGSPRDTVPPLLYLRNTARDADIGGMPTIAIRYRGDPKSVTPRLEAAWRGTLPNAPFEAETGELSLNAFYEPEEQRTRLLTLGAVVAGVIGCLGLYGLAAFNSERRTKEIGIRKVLGASTGDVLRLLVGQFLRPVVIANLLAWPIAYLLMREWLNSFDQRIELSPLYFLAATAIALTVALVTVAGQALKAARSDPGNALHYE